MSTRLSAVLPDATPDILAAIEAVGMPSFPLKVHGGPIGSTEFISRVRGHSVLISDGTRIAEYMLGQLPELRAIVFLGTGVDFYIDRAACESAGIRIEGISRYGDRTVAEHALGLMIAVYRDLGTQQDLMRAGGWGGRPLGELRGKTLGIVGLGGVGSELAMIAEAFGMYVITWSRSEKVQPFEQVDLKKLLGRSDVVSLHLAATPETKGLFDAATLGRMKRGAVLINTARAALVEEAGLIGALQSGQLAGAGLDVFDDEPPEASAAIRSAPNVVLSCHSGWRSPEAASELVRRAYERVDVLLKEFA